MSERRRLKSKEPDGTISLLHFDNTSGVIDECGRTWTKVGNGVLQILTDYKKFGSSCIYLDNQYGYYTELGIPVQDFTMEGFIRTDSDPSSGAAYAANWHNVFCCGNGDISSLGTTGIYLSACEFNSALTYYTKPGSTNRVFTVTKGTWNHVALVYRLATNTLDMYVNGTRIVNGESVTRGDWQTDGTLSLRISQYNSGCKTKLDEFRFSLGAIYSGDSITVPTTAFNV